MVAYSACSTCRRTACSRCLLIECPRLLFPFARRVIADATRDGGFPPLLIDPIDFVSLYRRRQQQAQAPRQAEGEPVASPRVGDGAST